MERRVLRTIAHIATGDMIAITLDCGHVIRFQRPVSEVYHVEKNVGDEMFCHDCAARPH